MPLGSTSRGLQAGVAISDRRCAGAGEDYRRVKLTRWPLRAGAWESFGWRVRAHEWLEKLGKCLKILENYPLGVCAKRFEVGLSGISVFAPKSLVLRENAASG